VGYCNVNKLLVPPVNIAFVVPAKLPTVT
jgi:hypothetical protein